MGIRNKERRRAKKRREPRDYPRPAGPDPRRSEHIDPPHRAAAASWPELVDRLINHAAHTEREDGDARLVRAQLVDRGTGPGWCSLVTERVALRLKDHATRALHDGWEPRDISAVVRLKAGAVPANIVASVLPDAVRRLRPDGPRMARWERQLTEIAASTRPLNHGSPAWASDIGAALSILNLLARLRPLPQLAATSRRQPERPDIDASVLDKVRALLAKAEATDFEEEADAFLTKAQELMTRYNLDRAALEEPSEDGQVAIEGLRCWLDEPYLKQKGYLLAVVAKANRCRSVSLYEYGFVTLLGHPDDLTATEMLFTALLVHATKQMMLPLHQAPARGSSGAYASRPSYRRSFLLSYANRIGARLSEAASAATEVALGSAGQALLPVLANRDRGVEEALHQMFPATRTIKLSSNDAAGWAAGRAAADMADLSWQPKLAGASPL